MARADDRELIEALAEEIRSEGIDPLSLVGSGEAPVFEKYDDYIPPHLLRAAYATDKLDAQAAAARWLEIEAEYRAIREEC